MPTFLSNLFARPTRHVQLLKLIADHRQHLIELQLARDLLDLEIEASTETINRLGAELTHPHQENDE